MFSGEEAASPAALPHACGCAHACALRAGGGEVSELPGEGTAEGTQSAGWRGREGAGGLLVAIQLTPEVPRARAGKTGANQSSHYVPGLSQGCLAQKAGDRR